MSTCDKTKAVAAFLHLKDASSILADMSENSIAETMDQLADMIYGKYALTEEDVTGMSSLVDEICERSNG